jgi:hypothetical protein
VSDDELCSPAPVIEAARPLTAAELLDEVAEPRRELPATSHGVSAARRSQSA